MQGGGRLTPAQRRLVRGLLKYSSSSITALKERIAHPHIKECGTTRGWGANEAYLVQKFPADDRLGYPKSRYLQFDREEGLIKISWWSGPGEGCLGAMYQHANDLELEPVEGNTYRIDGFTTPALTTAMFVKLHLDDNKKEAVEALVDRAKQPSLPLRPAAFVCEITDTNITDTQLIHKDEQQEFDVRYQSGPDAVADAKMRIFPITRSRVSERFKAGQFLMTHGMAIPCPKNERVCAFRLEIRQGEACLAVYYAYENTEVDDTGTLSDGGVVVTVKDADALNALLERYRTECFIFPMDPNVLKAMIFATQFNNFACSLHTREKFATFCDPSVYQYDDSKRVEFDSDPTLTAVLATVPTSNGERSVWLIFATKKELSREGVVEKLNVLGLNGYDLVSEDEFYRLTSDSALLQAADNHLTFGMPTPPPNSCHEVSGDSGWYYQIPKDVARAMEYCFRARAHNYLCRVPYQQGNLEVRTRLERLSLDEPQKHELQGYVDLANVLVANLGLGLWDSISPMWAQERFNPEQVGADHFNRVLDIAQNIRQNMCALKFYNAGVFQTFMEMLHKKHRIMNAARKLRGEAPEACLADFFAPVQAKNESTNAPSNFCGDDLSDKLRKEGVNFDLLNPDALADLSRIPVIRHARSVANEFERRWQYGDQKNTLDPVLFLPPGSQDYVYLPSEVVHNLKRRAWSLTTAHDPTLSSEVNVLRRTWQWAEDAWASAHYTIDQKINFLSPKRYVIVSQLVRTWMTAALIIGRLELEGAEVTLLVYESLNETGSGPDNTPRGILDNKPLFAAFVRDHLKEGYNIKDIEVKDGKDHKTPQDHEILFAVSHGAKMRENTTGKLTIGNLAVCAAKTLQREGGALELPTDMVWVHPGIPKNVEFEGTDVTNADLRECKYNNPQTCGKLTPYFTCNPERVMSSLDALSDEDDDDESDEDDDDEL